MINERMTFRLKFGKEEEAKATWTRMNELFPETNRPRDVRYRIYTNLTGRVNCITQDFMIKSLTDHNPMMYYWKINVKVQEEYAKFVTLCDTSVREMWNVEHEVGSSKNFKGMIMQQNIFRLNFGKARDSIAIWKEILDESKTADGPDLRMMTDIIGESYSLTVDAYFPNMTDLKPRSEFWRANDKMKSLYEKFTPLCYMSERNYFLVDFDL